MSEGHALLAPSSAHRWMACPGSAQLESVYPDTSSEASREGTALHEVAEACILAGKGAEMYKGSTVDGFEMTDERLDAVQQELDYFRSIYNPDIHELFVESKVKAAFIPSSGGTVDVGLSECLGTLHVLDHKFGRRRVDAEKNPQLRIYGAGMLEYLDQGHDEIIMHIGQPRIANFSSETLKVAELLEWVNDELKPAAELAVLQDPPLKAGDHCRWCKASAHCKTLAEYNISTAQMDFAGIDGEADRLPEELSDAEIGELLNRFPAIEDWIKEIRSEAFNRAKRGRKPGGWKLVRGRATRKWRDEKGVLEKLRDAGLDVDYFITPGKLFSVAQMEKVFKKDKIEDVDLSELWDKPVSYTLAKADDPREEVSTAEDDFNDV